MTGTSTKVFGLKGWKSTATPCVENMSRDLLLCNKTTQIVASLQTLCAPSSRQYGLITHSTRHGPSMRRYSHPGAKTVGLVIMTKALESMTKACTEARRLRLMIRECVSRREVLPLIHRLQQTGCGLGITRTRLWQFVSSVSQDTTKTQLQIFSVANAHLIP
jgi:hypothetical protein